MDLSKLSTDELNKLLSDAEKEKNNRSMIELNPHLGYEVVFYPNALAVEEIWYNKLDRETKTGMCVIHDYDSTSRKYHEYVGRTPLDAIRYRLEKEKKTLGEFYKNKGEINDLIKGTREVIRCLSGMLRENKGKK